MCQNQWTPFYHKQLLCERPAHYRDKAFYLVFTLLFTGFMWQRMHSRSGEQPIFPQNSVLYLVNNSIFCEYIDIFFKIPQITSCSVWNEHEYRVWHEMSLTNHWNGKKVEQYTSQNVYIWWIRIFSMNILILLTKNAPLGIFFAVFEINMNTMIDTKCQLHLKSQKRGRAIFSRIPVLYLLKVGQQYAACTYFWNYFIFILHMTMCSHLWKIFSIYI